MAASNFLTARIQLQGSEEIRASLQQLAQTGQQVFAQIARAAAQLGDVKVPTDQAKSDLAELARAGVSAFEQIGNAAGELQKAGAPALEALKDEVEEVKESSSGLVKILGNVREALSGKSAKTVLVGAGVVAGVAGLFKLVKDGVQNFTDLQKKADDAKLSLEEFQKLRFIFRELGLDAEQADKAISELVDANKKAAAVGLTTEAFEKLKKKLEDTGLSAEAAEKKIKELSTARGPQQIAEDARQAESAILALDIAEERLRRARGGAPDKRLEQELAERRASLDLAQAEARVLEQRAQALARLGPKVITTPEPVTAASLERLGQAVALIDDFDKQVERAKRLLTDEDIAKKFVGLVNDVGIDEAIRLFGVFRKVQEDGKKSADEFEKAQRNLRRSLLEVGFAADQSRTAFALLLAPALAPVIEGIANGIRFLNENLRLSGTNLREFASGIGNTVKPVIEDFFRLLSGKGDAEIKTEWLITLRDGIAEFGKGVVQVVDNVVKPAFFGLMQIAGDVANTFNEAFGTNVSATFVALAAVLATFTSGWRALAVAVLAAVGAVKSANLDFDALFKSFGIDLSGAIASIREFGAALKNAIASGDFSAVEASFKTLPGIILVVVGAIFALHAGAKILAPVLGRLFGVEVTAGSTLFLTAVAQISGVLPTLATLLGAAAAASILLLNAFKVLAVIFASPILLIGAIALLITNLEKAKEIAQSFANALNALFGTNLSGAEVLIGTFVALGTALVIVTRTAAGAAGPLAALAASAAAAALRFAPLVAAIAFIADFAANGFGKAGEQGGALVLEKQIDVLKKDLDAGKISADEFKTKVTELQQSFANLGISTTDAGAKSKSAIEGIASSFKDMFGEVFKSIEAVVFGNSAATTLVKNQWQSATGGVKAAVTDMGAGIALTAAEIDAAFERARTKLLSFKDARKGLSAESGGPPPGLTPVIDPKTGEVLIGLRNALKGVKDEAAGLGEAISALNLDKLGEELGAKSKEALDNLRSTRDAIKGIATDADEAVAPIDRINNGFDAFIQKRSALENFFDDAKAKIASLQEVAAKLANTLNPVSSAQAATDPRQQFKSGVGEALDASGRNATKDVQELKDRFNELAAAINAAMGAITEFRVAATDTNLENLRRALAEIDKLLPGIEGRSPVTTAVPEIKERFDEINFGIDQIKRNLQELKQPGIEIFDENEGEDIARIGTELQTVASTSERLRAAFADMFASIREGANAAVESLQRVAEAARASAAAAASSNAGASEAPGLAGGGYASGPGTATSDSILAWISNGEFVVQARAVAQLVQRYGASVMSWINRGELPRFAVGGLVDNLRTAFDVPRFAAGGFALAPAMSGAGALHPVTIDLGGGRRVAGLFAPPDVVEDLKRKAVLDRLASTGPSPSWDR